MNVNEQHDIVKKSLSQFIKKNIPGANLKVLDEVVLEYVISILEEASQDESFDVEGNCAYYGDFQVATISISLFSISRNDVGLFC
jgi:hypothetical protein